MKLVIAGFDGLSCSLFEQTDLPALRQLREQAQWGVLRSEEMETGASWTTVLTGWPVEVHGLRGFMGASISNKVYFYGRPHDYIFDELAQAGYRVGVVNFPTIDVPRAIGEGSWIIGGWPYEPRAYPGTIELPADYYTDIADYGKRAAPGREPAAEHHHYWWPQQVMDPDEYFAFVSANQRKRIELAAAAPPVDVLMLQCNVMDRAGHLLSYHSGYDGLGASHPAYGRFIEVVENSVWELQERFEPEFLAIVSDHGFAGRGHTAEGVWALRGPDVLPLRFDAEQGTFTPTVLDALGIRVVRQWMSVLHRRSEQAAQAETLKALGYL
jgi:hypothetical protein